MKSSVVMCLLTMVLLKAVYTPVKGSDPEYGQSAIERNDLPHREISRNVWLIQVPDGDVAEWEVKLNRAVKEEHGRFKVERATSDEKRRVENGEITLQK